jgi:hypothetical protein
MPASVRATVRGARGTASTYEAPTKGQWRRGRPCMYMPSHGIFIQTYMALQVHAIPWLLLAGRTPATHRLPALPQPTQATSSARSLSHGRIRCKGAALLLALGQQILHVLVIQPAVPGILCGWVETHNLVRGERVGQLKQLVCELLHREEYHERCAGGRGLRE